MFMAREKWNLILFFMTEKRRETFEKEKIIQSCIILLGGLNHLVQSRVEISHRLFGTLPIGLLLSNLDSRQLETSPMTSYDQF